MPDKYKAKAGETYRYAMAPMKLPRTKQKTKKNLLFRGLLLFFKILGINEKIDIR